MENIEYHVMNEAQRSHWWYKGRRFLLAGLIKKCGTSSLSEAAVLDIGCGAGEGRELFGAGARLTGIDPSSDALRFAGQMGYANLVRGSAEALPFPDKSFDAVLMTDVLEHVQHDAAALAEAYRVLKPTGVLVLTTPAYQWLWSGHDEALHHFRRYTKSNVVALMERVHFRITLASYYITLLFPAVAAFRVLERMVRNKKTSHFSASPHIFSALLERIVYLEGFLIRRGLRLPFGVSIVVIARRPA